MNTTLHQQLLNACNLINTVMSYEEQVNALEGEIRKFENKYQQLKKRGFRATPGVLRIAFIGGGLGILAYFCSVIFLATSADPDISNTYAPIVILGYSFGVPLFLVFLSLMYRSVYCKPKTKAMQKEAQKYWDEVGAPTCEKIRAQIDALRQEQRDYVSRNFDMIRFIPEAYRDRVAIPFMEQVVRNGRADTLKEAINLYEEQLHRWALERQAVKLAEEAENQSYHIRRQLMELEELQEKIKY